MAIAVSTNGNKPKLALNESVRLKLLKDKCFEGQNSNGAYYLYSVEHDGVEKIIFLTDPIHNAIVEAKLTTGDESILRKTPMQNGKKLTPHISIEFVERSVTVAAPVANPRSASNLCLLSQAIINFKDPIRGRACRCISV